MIIKKHGGAESINGIIQFSELSPDSAPLVISYLFINKIKAKMKTNQQIVQYFGILLTNLIILLDKVEKMTIFFIRGYKEFEITPRETQPNRRSPHLVGSHLSPRLLLSAAAPTPCLFPVAYLFPKNYPGKDNYKILIDLSN